MKQLQKQRKKIMTFLLTFGIVFGLLGAMPVHAQDENASESTTFDVKIVHIGGPFEYLLGKIF